jgi:hypothetical protein
MSSQSRERNQVPHAQTTISRQDFDAVVFDLDGVVTQTSLVHGDDGCALGSWIPLFPAP